MPPVLLLALISAGGATSATGSEIGDQQEKEGPMATTLELPRATPEEVGMSGVRLNKVSGVVQEFIDEGRIQYAVVGVARRGKVVYFEAQGVSNQEPVRTDAMFHMASSTKPILGVAAMMVIEEGLIGPSDPVEKYIPEFKGIKVAVLDEKAGGKKGFEKEPGTERVAFRDQVIGVSAPVQMPLAEVGGGVTGLPEGRGQHHFLLVDRITHHENTGPIIGSARHYGGAGW